MGPTAAGKTELAVKLTEALPCDIVSVDSALVYRGMDIGTAKPDAATLAVAPHRLIDICDPAEVFSAARFRERALAEIRDIHSRGRIPLLAGGTMLYFRALEHGLSPLPAADPSVRARLDAALRQQGLAALHARLAEVDPQSAARIHVNDTQRTLRALEVYEISGEPLSAWHGREAGAELPFRVVKVVLGLQDRAAQGQRIEQRFRAMLQQGFVAEVEALFARGDLHAGLPSMRAVGYRQIWGYLEGEYDYDTMVEKGLSATRQLAKRQRTWLRDQPREALFEAADPLIHVQVLKYLAANAI